LAAAAERGEGKAAAAAAAEEVEVEVEVEGGKLESLSLFLARNCIALYTLRNDIIFGYRIRF
jgi:hypothetical protein